MSMESCKISFESFACQSLKERNEASKTEVPFVKNYCTALHGYRKHPGDIMSEVEKENVIGPGNILMAVEDIDVA
jgi:hypothetical protein